jgi:hypothetical protein
VGTPGSWRGREGVDVSDEAADEGEVRGEFVPVPPGTGGLATLQWLGDGRLVLSMTLADPQWSWLYLTVICRTCHRQTQTEQRIYRSRPHAVDTTVTRRCPCGGVQVVPEVYTIFDQSGRQYKVRNARRSPITPTGATAEKFKQLAATAAAYQRGEATDQELVEAAVQVHPAVTKRLKKEQAWKDGNWPVIAALILSALALLPGYVGMYLSLTSDEPAPVPAGHLTIPVEDFLDLLDRAARSRRAISPDPAGSTDPKAPPASPPATESP